MEQVSFQQLITAGKVNAFSFRKDRYLTISTKKNTPSFRVQLHTHHY